MKKIISIILMVVMLSVIIFVLSGCQNNTKQKAVNNDVDKSRTNEINVNKLLEDLEYTDTDDETRQDKSKSKVTVPEVNYGNTSVIDAANDILDSLSTGSIDDIDVDDELKNIIKEYKYGNKNEAQRKFKQYQRKYEEERNKENEEIAKKILEDMQNIDN